MTRDAPVTLLSPQRRQTPSPRGYPLIGVLPQIVRDPLSYYLRVRKAYGDLAVMSVGPYRVYLLSHPDYIKYVLQDNHLNYHKSILYENVKPVVGNGLLTSEGDFWRRQRRLAQPAFHKRQIAALATLMTSETQTMLEGWHQYNRQAQPFDIAAEMMRLTMQIATKSLFSTVIKADADKIAWAMEVGQEGVMRDLWRVVKLPDFIPIPSSRRYAEAKRVMFEIVDGIIAERRQSGQDQGDLLSMLMLARDEETGEGMSNRQLRDEIITLFIAGHETTSNALTWTWYLLAQHPEVLARLQAELATHLNGRLPTVEDLSKLTYTKQVLEESMRLYPPVWIISRRPLADDEISGHHIQADTVVAMSSFVTHRHPDFWHAPETFNPDHFLPKQTEQRPRYAYFPFAGGPRQCIGNHFAMMGAQLILATVAQRYRLELIPGCKVTPNPLVTLRPKSGVMMSLSRSKICR